MKKTAVIMLFVAFSTIAFAQKSASDFNKELQAVKATFTMPSGYESVAIIPNKQLGYKFAIKNKKEDFEVRYMYYPITDQDMVKYHKCVKDPDCSMLTPNVWYKSILMSNLLNMANNHVKTYDLKDAASFNANKARTSIMFDYKSKFGKGYKSGQAYIIHKDNVGDIVVIFMTNNPKNHVINMRKAFNAVKFK